MTAPSTPASANERRLGIAGLLGTLVGAGTLAMAMLGFVNTAFELDWGLRVYGAPVDIPDNYESCIAVAMAGVLLVGLSLFGSRVLHAMGDAKGRPLRRVGIALAALGFLGAVGYGLYIWAILDTYGSFLAYYATDGDLDDLRGELAEDPSPEDLDMAVSRAAQYDNAAALGVLMEAGADLRQSTQPNARCLLDGVSVEFVRTALAHGVTVDSCPNSEGLVGEILGRTHGDDGTAIASLLTEAGWPNTAVE